jgi:Cu+-exporting ATPase
MRLENARTLTPPLAGSAGYGAIAFGALLAVYFGALTAISGWKFTAEQFADYWYYILPLAAGFGLQLALYMRLREVLHGAGAGRGMLAASGTTSTAAMVSCCAHYLMNVAPVLGATGLVTFAAQYQVEFFWVGIAFNAAGIAFIGSRLWKATKEHAQCAHD